MAASEIKGLTIEIGANTTNFTKAMKDIETEARNISKDLKIVDDTLKTNSQSAEAAAAKLNLLKDAYKNASAKVETIQEAIKKLNREYADNKSNETYREQIKQLEAQLKTATLEQDRALEKVIAFKDAEEETAESTSMLGDIIKGNLISEAITKGLEMLGDLLKTAANYAVDAVKEIGKFIGESIDLASNMEETRSKVNAVFGEEGQKQIEEWAENAAHDFHTTQQNAMETAAAFGNILENMGMTTEEAQKYSEELVLVGAAQADFNNLKTEDVLAKIESALTGNYKGLQSLGIVLNDNIITQQALNDTGKESAEQLTDLEKKNAALKLIIESSDTAIQKYTENSGSLVSMQSELKAKFQDVKTEIGERLYPVAEKLFNKIVDFTNTEEFSSLLNTLYDTFSEIAQAVLDFVNSGRIESFLTDLQNSLPNATQKISDMGAKISETINSIWSLIDAISTMWSNLTDRGGRDLENLEPGRHYGMASGGFVEAGRMYRVNDDAGRRTEWFVPAQNGYILNGNQTDRIVNNNNSRNYSGGINIYVNSYGMNVAEVADELGQAFANRMRMSGAIL